MKNIFLLGFLFLSVAAFAQNTRAESWFVANTTFSITKKWSVGFDLQHRRQSNYFNDDRNPVSLGLNYTVRAWVYYKLPQNWTITTAPLGYFNFTDIKNKAGDARNFHELRTMWGIVKRMEWGKLKNINRLAYEARFIQWDMPDATVQHRYRLQNTLVYPIYKFSDKLALNAFGFNEFIMRTQNGKTEFDRNRVVLAPQLKFGKHDLSIGYQWMLQNGGIATDINKDILLVLMNFNF